DQKVRSLPASRRRSSSARFGTGRSDVWNRRIDAVAPARSFQPVHEDYRGKNPEFPEEECFGAGHSTRGRRGASPVPSELRAEGGEPGKFHAIRVAVKNRPELQAKTREGYWALQ